jgi:hypothetical protein
MKSEFVWFGYVNQMLYGLDLEREVSDARIDRLATELIEPRFPSRPVATYYRAAVSALESTDWAADGQYGVEPTFLPYRPQRVATSHQGAEGGHRADSSQ